MAAIFIPSSLAAAALGFTAVANADEVCPGNTVRIQGEIVVAPAQPCDTDQVGGDGLLGDLAVVGNLPGLGGVL